ncbi:alpha/beta fold hydrolase [Pararhodobacter marinus]|uniref:alpha/beta fold hydrolase n=1 Tax=Pararhodobacter marinus TaxID=2184063 RepID=UPI003517B8BC
MPDTTRLDTPFGTIALLDSGDSGRPVLLVHGNSACKEAFAPQFDAPELAGFRLIAPDLPGHGASDDAPDPGSAYTFAGYAALLEHLIAALGLASPVVFGWSLGGHAALELAGRGKAPVAGVMISGTPPVTPTLDCLMQAFNIDPAAENLTAKRDFTEEDAQAYALHTGAVDGAVDPHLLAMVKRTDGRARETMFGSVVAGAPLDERQIVADMTVPFAVVNGAEDPFIKPDYFDTLTAPSLWSEGIVRLQGAGHAPFRQTPGAFNPLLARFVQAC